jgi:hypothetical protein
MPCCAFAAFLFSQLVLGLAAIKRIVLPSRAESRAQTNAVVEWRLAEPGRTASSSAIRRPRRLSMPIVALAALLELALLCGTIYSVRVHLGHVHHDAVGTANSQ